MAGLPLVGGCMCGALRYEVSAPPLMVYNCHCTNCQKIGGAAFHTAATVMEASVRFTAGEPARVEWAADSGAVRVGLFCGACGTRIAQWRRAIDWHSQPADGHAGRYELGAAGGRHVHGECAAVGDVC